MPGKMKLSVSLILLMILSFSCKKETEYIPELKILVEPAIVDAKLSWSITGQDTSIAFTIYLNNTLIRHNLKEHEFVLRNLEENTWYTGKIVAVDKKNRSTEAVFSFLTLTNQAPAAFELITSFISGDSVSISWKPTIDPEGGAVLYDVSLNNQLIVKDLANPGFSSGNLSSQTLYRIDVAAKDTLNKATMVSLNFKTLKPDSKLIHRVMPCQGLSREFGYYIPSGISGKNVPLVIYLHGAGGVAWPELTKSLFLPIAEREKFIFAMPQALSGTTLGGTYLQWNAHEVLGWDDVLFIHAMIDSLSQSHAIDAGRIYLCGMSNGGFMTFYMAGKSNRFAAIAPMSGLMTYNIFNNYKTQWPLPLLYIHNTGDPIVKFNGEPGVYPSTAEVIRLWVRGNGCDTVPVETRLPDINTDDNSTVTLFKYTGKNPKSEVRLYRINGGNHSIPGVGSGANQDINAFEVIWDFFKGFSESR